MDRLSANDHYYLYVSVVQPRYVRARLASIAGRAKIFVTRTTSSAVSSSGRWRELSATYS